MTAPVIDAEVLDWISGNQLDLGRKIWWLNFQRSGDGAEFGRIIDVFDLTRLEQFNQSIVDSIVIDVHDLPQRSNRQIAVQIPAQRFRAVSATSAGRIPSFIHGTART
ncbi:MAG: hypothetical protein U0103_04190 [Candidatus Obscuribacterales bacterium]